MAWLAGRLVDETGAPVVGVEVHCGPHIDPRVPYQTLRSTTDATGQFRFDDLVAGHYRCGATQGSGKLAHELLPTDREVRFVLKQLALTSVTVRGDDGPIANAQIAFGDWFVTTTDAQGHAMAPRLRMLRVSAPGYAGSRTGPKLGAEHEVTLVRGALMRGVVLDRLGQPLPDARVMLLGPAGANVYTDREGRWGALLSAGRYEIRAWKILDVADERIFVEHDGIHELDGVTVRTRWPATLKVSVVDRARSPAVGARVCIRPVTGTGTRWETTNSAGEHTARLLVPGVYSVCATTDREGSDIIGVELGEGNYEVTIVVEPERAVAGRVVDAGGTPVRDVEVSASSPMQDRVVTDEEGRFAIGGLPTSQMPDGLQHLLATSRRNPALIGDAKVSAGDMNVTIVVGERSR